MELVDTAVLIAGPGLAGWGLAIDLGLRGIPVTVVAAADAPAAGGDVLGERTMEVCRRWGIASAVRSAAAFGEQPPPPPFERSPERGLRYDRPALLAALRAAAAALPSVTIQDGERPEPIAARYVVTGGDPGGAFAGRPVALDDGDPETGLAAAAALGWKLAALLDGWGGPGLLAGVDTAELAPHAWLDDGRSTLDLFGPAFALLGLGATPHDPAVLVAAFVARSVPLDVRRIADPLVAARYQRPLVLVQPDGRIVWRGDALPADPLALVDRLRGM